MAMWSKPITVSSKPSIRHYVLGAVATSLIEVGERIGRLPQALERLVHEQTADARRDVAAVWFYRAYPIVMSLVLATVLSLILVFVIPKFEQIFRDFGTKLPYITQVVLDISRDLGPLLLVITFIAILWSAGQALWEMAHPMRGAPSFLVTVRDRILWILPVTHGIEKGLWSRVPGVLPRVAPSSVQRSEHGWKLIVRS